MNQTQKRLSIINHAISITDVETIQLQVLKLGQLKTDEKIQEILTMIQTENYGQAQGLITRYIEAPTENILQRTSQEAQTIMAAEDQAIIDEFDLFITSGSQQKPQEFDINDFFIDEFPVKPKETNSVDLEALLNIDVDNVLTDNIKLEVTHPSKDTFFEYSKARTKQTIDTSNIPKDTFFDTEETVKIETVKKEITSEEETPTEETTIIENDSFIENDPFKEIKPTLNIQEKIHPTQYNAIPYIAQKLISMKKQYPPIEKTYEKFDSVEDLLRKISQEGYTEEDIEETLDTIKKLSEEKNASEAVQLLLVCAATESKFAHFMLARELYKGVLLIQNIPEAFTKMYSLAMEDYPESLCDLAQFYEHGIGISKDKKKAEQFYKEAMDLGIKRAENHYIRLKKQNHGFFKR